LSAVCGLASVRDVDAMRAKVVEANPRFYEKLCSPATGTMTERKLRERVGQNGNRIRFLPPVSGDEKDELLQSCSVLLFPPTAREGHPRVVLEAICRGTPLVTNDRGAIVETVSDGESAFVLADPDPEELADRILGLLDDQDLRERMGKAARGRYERGYTQEIADRQLADWLSLAARSDQERER
jgi:glycosyltransferase involved in cell wall biosynthesis